MEEGMPYFMCLLIRVVGITNRKRYDHDFGGTILKPRSVKPTRLSNGRQCISAGAQQLAVSVKVMTVLCARAGRT